MFKLPPEVHARLERDRAAEQGYKVTFANLSDEHLAASARFWMQFCEQPKRIEAGTVVYDSTFWHVIVPEMIRRLERS